MVDINEVRNKFPEYNDLNDNQLLNAIHKKYYSDIPTHEFHMKAINKAKKPESFGSQLMRGPKNVAAGLAKTGHKLLNLPSNIARGLGDVQSADILSFRPGYNYDETVGLPKEKEWHDIAVQMIPELVGAFAVPEFEGAAVFNNASKIGPYLNKILSQALPQAGYSAAMAEPGQAGQAATVAGLTMAPFSAASQLAQSTSPWARRGAQAIGAFGGYELGKNVTEGIGSSPQFADLAGVITGGLGARGMTSSRMMQQRLTEGMKPEIVNERLEAARRLGLDYLTPAEASLNPFLGGRQGAVGTTSEGSQLMYQKGQGRVKSEEKSISDTLNMIYQSEKMKPKINELYKESFKSSVPDTFINKFSDNEIIKHAQKDVMSSPAFKQKLKNIPHDSIEYWDLTKRAISDLEKKAAPGEKELYTQARRELVDELDNINPFYKEARALAERGKVRKGLEKAFDKTDPSGKSFFKALASKEKFEKLMHNLRNVPEAQQRLKDMRMLFGDLISPPTIRGAAAKEATSMNKPRSSIQAATDAIGNALTKGKYDKEMIDFITNPNWDKMMKDLNKISDKQKRFAKFIEYFGKSSAQMAAQTRPFMKTENYEIY